MKKDAKTRRHGLATRTRQLPETEDAAEGSKQHYTGYVMYAGSLVMKYNVLERDMSLEAQMELLDSCSSLHAE